MVDVITEIEINAPLERVYEYASDPDNACEWYVNIKTSEWLSEKPLQIGSQIGFKAEFMGKQLSYVYGVQELIPHQKMVMKTTNGPFPMETTYTWETIGAEKTLMTLRNRGLPKGFSKLMAPLMVPMMRKANKKDLKEIKRILEENTRTE